MIPREVGLTRGCALPHSPSLPHSRVATVRKAVHALGPVKEPWGRKEIRAGGITSQKDFVTQSYNPGPMHEGSPEDFWFTTTIFTLHRMCPRSNELYFAWDLFVKRKSRARC